MIGWWKRELGGRETSFPFIGYGTEKYFYDFGSIFSTLFCSLTDRIADGKESHESVAILMRSSASQVSGSCKISVFKEAKGHIDHICRQRLI